MPTSIIYQSAFVAKNHSTIFIVPWMKLIQQPNGVLKWKTTPQDIVTII